MLQEVMTEPGKIEFRKIAIPKISDNDVLIKVEEIGICGSDIHVNHGTHPFTKYPVTQGHEVAGEVVDKGKNVNDLKVGDKVTIEPQIACGKCYPCRHGKYNLCEELRVMGFQTTGTASEFFAANQKNVTLLPENMSFEDGAMLEPLSVAVHAVHKGGDMIGKRIVVIGAGPIGNLVAQSAKGLSAKAVMLTDVSDYRLNLAKELGIDYCVNTRDKSFSDAVTECFGSDKADIIYDCAGNDTTIDQAIQTARKGSKIILVAVFADIAKVDLAVLNDHELCLDTSMMYRHEDFIEAINLVDKNKVQLKSLQTKHFKFRDYKKAYDYIDENKEKTMKVLIDVQK